MVLGSTGKYASFKRNDVACIRSHASGKTTMTKEDGMQTQISGIYVSSNTKSYASMRDNRVAVGSVLYYGKIWFCSNVFGLIQLPVEALNKTIWSLPTLISLVRYIPVIEKTMNRTY
ncbi:hypothetical protein AHAS_Ahas15G0296100 [Arachis hypogaea]